MSQNIIKSHQDLGKKNFSIEFWRFAFALSIAIMHFNEIYQIRLYSKVQSGFFPGAYLGVDFFFILSGFLLVSHYNQAVINGKEESAFYFTFGKIKHIYAYYIVAFFLLMLHNILQIHYASPLSFIKTLAENIFQYKWEIVLLQMSELGEKTYINFPTWYISVMLICNYFIYALIKKNKSNFINIIAPLIIIVGGGYLANKWSNISMWHDYNGLLNYGWIRGMIDGCIGCLIYELYQKLLVQKNSWTKFQIAMINMVEIIFIVRVVYAIYTHKNGRDDFWDIFLMAGIILIAFLKVTYIDHFLDNYISAFLGQMSLVIYLNQAFLFALFLDIIGLKYNFGITLMIALIVLNLGSVLIKYIIDTSLNTWFKNNRLRTKY